MADEKTFDYTPFDIKHPAGKNSLTARAKFYQRSLYKEEVYPKTATKPLDMWYDKNLFGRVDRHQYTIMSKTGNLVPITHAKQPNLYCFNFVNDAFTDFVGHMKVASLAGCLNPGGNEAILRPTAVSGWVSPTATWKTHKDTIINAFIKAFRENKQKPIKNYSDFKPVFIAYLKQVAQMTAITKTSFLLTYKTNPFISGLMIGIQKANAGDDSVKYEDYIDDPNFDFYVGAAKKFGLTVNKNMPWVLTADLFTNALLKYLSRYWIIDTEQLPAPGDSPVVGGTDHNPPGYALTPQNFFGEYYTRAYLQDFEDLNTFIVDAYTHFVNRIPTYGEEKISWRPDCPSPLQTRTFYRYPLYDHPVLNTKDLIELYIHIRYYESGRPPVELGPIRKRAYEVYRTALLQPSPGGPLDGMQSVLFYINALFKDYIYPVNYGSVNSNYTVDKIKEGDIIDTASEVMEAITAGDAMELQEGPLAY